MKYTTEIVVDVPREEFIKKMDDPDNMKHWQQGLIGYEQLSASPGQEGSRMSLSYEMGKRKMDLVETIIKKDLPEEIHMTYETKGVHNIQKNYFKEEGEKNPLGIRIGISIFWVWDETYGIFNARSLQKAVPQIHARF